MAQGGGEHYFSAFALYLHATPLHIGILAALPQFVGVIAQLASVKLVQHFGHPHRLLLTGGWAQTLCWVPLLALPFLFPQIGPWLLVGCAMLYFAFGHGTAPVWHSLLAGLVEPEDRGSYFAKRARMTALASFVALGVAGSILTLGQSWEIAWLGFVVVFLGSAAARLAALRCQMRISTSGLVQGLEAPKGFRHFLFQTATLNFRNFLLFSGSMHFAVLLSGPFFVVYLLRDLHWTYLHYAGWMASSLLAQFLTLTPWGQFGDRYGNKLLLTMTSLAVPLLPLGYVLSENYLFLLGWNFGGGVIWAGLSLGLQNYVLDSVRPEERTRGIALTNAMNAVGWGLGALTGSWLATVMPATLAIGSWELAPASNLPLLFALSGILRLTISVSLLHRFTEPRAVGRPPHQQLFRELPIIKPLAARLDWRSPRVAQ